MIWPFLARGGGVICAQLLMHAIVRGGCTDTVREFALVVDWGGGGGGEFFAVPGTRTRVSILRDIFWKLI